MKTNKEYIEQWKDKFVKGINVIPLQDSSEMEQWLNDILTQQAEEIRKVDQEIINSLLRRIEFLESELKGKQTQWKKMY